VSSNREAIEPRGERPTDQRPGLPARPAVLIVEDDSLLRITTASYLRDEGFDVIEAADADQAIRVLGYTAVDAVFSDVSRQEARTASHSRAGFAE
jgi:DNA-binding NtrC family response regulator